MPDQKPINKGHFAPGHAKLGGRKKTVTRARDLVTKYGDPLVWMLRLLRDGVYDAVVIDPVTGKKTKVPTVAPLELLLDAAKTCVGFVHPKLSATQLTGEGGGPIESVSFNIEAVLNDPVLAHQAQALALQLTEVGQDVIPDNGAVVVYDAEYEASK
jgi:hypothetical protein